MEWAREPGQSIRWGPITNPLTLGATTTLPSTPSRKW
jgi:hypothetical protein